MATGKRAGRGIKDRNVGSSAGIRPYKLDLAYASSAAFLAAKALDGENSSSAQEGDFFYNTTINCLMAYDGSDWKAAGFGSKYTHIIGSFCAPVAHLGGAAGVSDGVAGAVATGATGTLTNVNLGNGYPNMVIYNEGANTGREVPGVVVDANCCDGLELPSTNTENVGGTITFGAAMPNLAATPSNPCCFTVGTDPAFFMEVKIGIPLIAEYDILGIGFVEPVAAYVGSIAAPADVKAAYDEKAIFSLADAAGDIDFDTSVAGADTNTDTDFTDWVDDAVKTLRINVSAAGAVTYTLGGVADGNAVAATLANGTVVTPCIIFGKSSTVVGDTPPIIEYIKFGHQ